LIFGAALVGVAACLWIAVLDLPSILGIVIMDGPDPDRPGHLTGVGPSLLGFISRIAIAFVCIRFAVLLRRKTFAENSELAERRGGI